MKDPIFFTEDDRAFRRRYKYFDNIQKLQRSLSFHRKALSLCPPGHPDRGTSLNDIANRLACRHEQLGNIEDLEESISFRREFLCLCPVGHPDHSISLFNLAIDLRTRYKQFGTIGDLQESITLDCKALGLYPLGHRLHYTSLHHLSTGLTTRSQQLPTREDLEWSISLNHRPFGFLQVGHCDRSSSHNNLDIGLRTQYQQFGSIGDLEESIPLNCEALNPCPLNHYLQIICLHHLASGLRLQYKQLGNTDDLEESVLLDREALRLCPVDHPGWAASLNDLTNGLIIHYNYFGDVKDLEESILLCREALSLCPVGHPYQETSRNSLGVGLNAQYEHFGNSKDPEESIALHREELSSCRFRGLDCPMVLNTLASCLNTQSEQLGNIDNLEESILLGREALRLCPIGCYSRSSFLSNLSLYLRNRYERLGDIEDLEESIILSREAIRICPVGDTNRDGHLIYLALSLIARHEQSRNSKDLEESVLLGREALGLCAVGHYDYNRSSCLNTLAICLHTRYDQLGNIEDLEECISLNREALSLLPVGHPLRSASLTNLGVHLRTRYKRLGNIEDLEETISLHRKVLFLFPIGHSFHSLSLTNLATDLHALYKYYKKQEYLQDIFTCYEQAANDPSSYLTSRLSAAIKWTSIARNYQHHSILNAYTTSLHLVHHFLIFRPDVQAQQMFLATAGLPQALASDAASAAIEAGNLELAVEFLEQGRAVLWSKTDAYKSPLEQLRQALGGAKLADQFETLSAELERLVLSNNTLDATPSSRHSLDARMKLYRVRSQEFNRLVQRIRQMDGFSHFLQTPPFQTLQTAATDGPVILINISEYRSDAIILTINNPPNLVPLPDIHPAELVHQANRLTSNRGVIRVLRDLWDSIVEPVVNRLGEMGIEQKSRIWWCPTAELCALPLHAAGYYPSRKRNLPDMYISSYTSTLSSLIRARSNIGKAPRVPKLLVVGQPDRTLQNVEEEVDLITQHAGFVGEVLVGAEATHEAVLDGLQQHSWVHFACHGHLGDNNQPFRASFELSNTRRLTLLELIQKRVPNAECAVLAACHSAAGDSRTPDESIHLSAALQFCGFRSVVGTLWEMDDEDGPMMAREFYKYMFRNPERIDFRDSAQALSLAIQAMRDAGLPPERWVMFVHIGA